MSADSVHAVPSNTSVCATICLAFWPPVTTSLSPTVATAGAARGCSRFGSSVHAPPRNAKTLFDPWPMLSLAPPTTTTSPL
jgi:hypothetical protein